MQAALRPDIRDFAAGTPRRRKPQYASRQHLPHAPLLQQDTGHTQADAAQNATAIARQDHLTLQRYRKITSCSEENAKIVKKAQQFIFSIPACRS